MRRPQRTATAAVLSQKISKLWGGERLALGHVDGEGVYWFHNLIRASVRVNGNPALTCRDDQCEAHLNRFRWAHRTGRLASGLRANVVVLLSRDSCATTRSPPPPRVQGDCSAIFCLVFECFVNPPAGPASSGLAAPRVRRTWTAREPCLGWSCALAIRSSGHRCRRRSARFRMARNTVRLPSVLR